MTVQCKTQLKGTKKAGNVLRHLDLVTDGLDRHFGPPKFNCHLFSSLEKGLFDMLIRSLMALISTLTLRSIMATLFSSLEKGLFDMLTRSLMALMCTLALRSIMATLFPLLKGFFFYKLDRSLMALRDTLTLQSSKSTQAL
jgi:hypothetical protein